MKPYDRPVSLAKVRMLAPFSYFFFRSALIRVRVEPVIRFPFLTFAIGDMIGAFQVRRCRSWGRRRGGQ